WVRWTSLSLRQVANRFDVVAVEVEDKSSVVVRMVLRPHAGRTVVASAGPQCGVVEGAYLGAGVDREGDVRGRRGRAVAADPELRLATLAEAARPDLASGLLWPHLHHECDSERRQCCSVEGLGAFVVGDTHAEVIDDHASTLPHRLPQVRNDR